MHNLPDIAAVASLIGDATRAAMLMALMDGRAYTATELALFGEVTASTASTHLARLSSGGLIKQVKQGRHRYYHLASKDVAEVLEKLMSISANLEKPKLRNQPNNQALRRARICYDHLAGEAGVQLKENLIQQNYISEAADNTLLTDTGLSWCVSQQIPLDTFTKKRRPACRVCLDWSERKTHIAGALGAAILNKLFSMRFAHQEPDSRIITLNAAGNRFIQTLIFSP